MSSLYAEIVVGSIAYSIQGLSKIEFSGQDRSNSNLPSWGICSNSGNLEAYDADGTIELLNNNGVLLQAPINIYLKTGNRTEQIGGFYIKGVSIDKNGSLVKIDFQDVLVSWQNINMPRYYYPFKSSNLSSIHLIDVLNELIQSANVKLNIDNSNIYHFNANYRLPRIYIKIPTLSEGSLWSQITKICEVSSCYIYCDNKGIPTIYYGGDT